MRWQRVKWIVPVIVVLAAFAGFLDALYLTVEHYRGVSVGCRLFGGTCDVVLQSRYATVGGLPLALLGAVYYQIIFLLSVAYFDTRRPWFMNVAARFSVVGALASLALLYLQFFVLHSVCQYCLLSAALSLTIFIASVLWLVSQRRGV